MSRKRDKQWLNLVIFVTGIMIITLLLTQRSSTPDVSPKLRTASVIASGSYTGLAINGRPVPHSLWLQWVTSGQWTEWMLALISPNAIAEEISNDRAAVSDGWHITLLGPKPVEMEIWREGDAWLLKKHDENLRFSTSHRQNKHLFPDWLLNTLHAGTP